MNADQAEKLRAPFPAAVVGKLPRVWCRACRDNKQQRHCGEHAMTRCATCKSRITEAHLHLDYVGHAETTDRLLQVDPEWTWEPVATDQHGLPCLDSHGGLWIRLTVAGVTRLGYGHADGKSGPDAVKESIGDAIRNASMRFGVALDLWGATPPPEQAAEEPPTPAARPAASPPTGSPARMAGIEAQIKAAQDEATLDALLSDLRAHIGSFTSAEQQQIAAWSRQARSRVPAAVTA